MSKCKNYLPPQLPLLVLASVVNARNLVKEIASLFWGQKKVFTPSYMLRGRESLLCALCQIVCVERFDPDDKFQVPCGFEGSWLSLCEGNIHFVGKSSTSMAFTNHPLNARLMLWMKHWNWTFTVSFMTQKRPLGVFKGWPTKISRGQSAPPTWQSESFFDTRARQTNLECLRRVAVHMHAACETRLFWGRTTRYFGREPTRRNRWAFSLPVGLKAKTESRVACVLHAASGRCIESRHAALTQRPTPGMRGFVFQFAQILFTATKDFSFSLNTLHLSPIFPRLWRDKNSPGSQRLGQFLFCITNWVNFSVSMKAQNNAMTLSLLTKIKVQHLLLSLVLQADNSRNMRKRRSTRTWGESEERLELGAGAASALTFPAAPTAAAARPSTVFSCTTRCSVRPSARSVKVVVDSHWN